MKTCELWGCEADCSGCGACAARCPKGAISLVQKEGGFLFPEVDSTLCVDCGLCRKVCGYQNQLAQKSEGPWFAASYQGDCSKSASAGAFFAIARNVVQSGGVVFGAANIRDDSGLHVRHIATNSLDELDHLRGSKYVQSDAIQCFSDVSQQLSVGRVVLFSGTPCQVAGLRGYLGRDLPNLITVDLICHGVPSEAMLRGYLEYKESQYGRRVVDAQFRCKKNGWPGSLLLDLKYADGVHEYIPAENSSYYDLFLRLKSLRASCYSCPFAGELRSGDFTMGDFWGVEQNCPEVLDQVGFDIDSGISCLLVNSANGREALKQYGEGLTLYDVSFDDIAKGNEQLRHPSALADDRALYLDAFYRGGWDAVERLWKHRERGIVYQIRKVAWLMAPQWLLDAVSKMRSKR